MNNSPFKGKGRIDLNSDNWEINIGNLTNEKYLRNQYRESPELTGIPAKLTVRGKVPSQDVSLHIYLGDPKNPSDKRRKYGGSYIGKPREKNTGYLNDLLSPYGFAKGQKIDLIFDGGDISIL